MTLFLFILFVLLNSYFKVQRIYVITREKNIPLRGLHDFQNESLILLSKDFVEKNLLEKNPLLKGSLVEKKFPNELSVEIYTYRPIASFKVREGYFILSEDGKILAKTKNLDNNLSLIQYYQLFDYYYHQAGDILDYKDILKTIFFLKQLNDFGFVVERIDINSLSMIVFNLRGTQIFFSSEKDSKKQLYEFENIIKRFNIEGKQFKSLDLRFDKPIVKF